MNTDHDTLDQPLKPAPGRLALHGVSAVIAVAIAVNALFGAMSAGVVSADRYADGVVARYVAVAIVRNMDRARVRDQDVPAAASTGLRIGALCVSTRTKVLSQVDGSIALERLTLMHIDLPPPVLA